MNTKIDAAFLGDSLTFGYGVPKDYCWVTKLINHFNYNGINKGINGDTTPSMLSRIDKDILFYNPEFIFIMGGSNDILLNRSVESILENLKLMILESLKITPKVIVGIPPYIISSMAYRLFSESAYYDNAEKKLIFLKKSLLSMCKDLNVKTIDFYSLTKNKPELYIDGIHLNKEGNNLLYEFSKSYFSK